MDGTFDSGFPIGVRQRHRIIMIYTEQFGVTSCVLHSETLYDGCSGVSVQFWRSANINGAMTVKVLSLFCALYAEGKRKV